MGELRTCGAGAAERLVVIGHRGKGMNALASPDRRLKEVKENSLRSFNEAARFAIDFVEFDVQVVLEFAKERPIVFSSFQPDAARLMRGLQNVYPVSSVPSHRGFGACYLISQVPTQVFFLTNGGTEIYRDARRNSLDEAIKLCTASGLQGIVSEVRAFFRNPAAVARIKESNLALLTYGQLNNVPKAVYMQQLLGVNGVIVDLVKEITEALRPHPMQLK
ncbi:hypothetical protein BHE74_00031640 [Ensete ventricosum]|nr:hypothetical protein BHE74_00031640 [Ensete ventricosum]